VAHPESKDYGQHWSPQKVADMFAPAPETVAAVKEWLVASGIDLKRVKMSKSRNWLTFDATAAEADTLLKTEYHLYKHVEGHEHIACDDYSIPSHLTEHIDIVTPTIHFNKKISGPKRTQPQHDLPPPLRELNKRMELSKRQDASRPPAKLGSAEDQSNPKQGAVVNNALMSLENCDTMITPQCLQALYAVPPGSMAMKNNTLGVVEYTPQAFLQSDLNMYFKQFAPDLTQTAPNVNLIDGAIIQTANQSFTFNGESALDLEFAMSLIAPQQVTVYQVGDIVEGGSFNNFLDALDASYCTFEGGDSKDPSLDGQLPRSKSGRLHWARELSWLQLNECYLYLLWSERSGPICKVRKSTMPRVYEARPPGR
jgi:tripeptidyl-peptidase-1